jgi:hypothetical protein
MTGEFRETSNQSIWALAKHITVIADVLKQELPFDTLTPSCHVEDGTGDFTIGVLARRGDCHCCIMIYTHCLDAPPEPREVYPEGCCAVGALQVFSPEASLREVLETCGTPERWMAHHNDRWVPLSPSYVAFLMGMSSNL